jgi:hypothetical protein
MLRAPDEELARAIEQFKTLPIVATQLPLRLMNGSTVTHLTPHCANCRGEIAKPAFRATMVEAPGYSVRVEGLAKCVACQVFTPIDVYLVPTKSNGSETFRFVTPRFRSKFVDCEAEVIPFRSTVVPFKRKET